RNRAGCLSGLGSAGIDLGVNMLKLLRLLFLSLSLASLSLHAQELLDPEQAFRFSARAVDAQTVELRWEIAPGYYMYRDKFSFSVEPGTLGSVDLPPGIVKEDETFGRVETYRDLFSVRLPLSGAGGNVTLRATSQGCADIGICYPPQKHAATLTLPAPGSSAEAAPPVTAAPAWQTRLLRPSILGPALLGLFGVALAAVPLRVRRGLWFKGAGFLLMFSGAVLLLMLNSDESADAQAAATPASAQAAIAFTPVRNLAELDALLALARQEGRPALLDF